MQYFVGHFLVINHWLCWILIGSSNTYHGCNSRNSWRSKWLSRRISVAWNCTCIFQILTTSFESHQSKQSLWSNLFANNFPIKSFTNRPGYWQIWSCWEIKIWASTWENVLYLMCVPGRLRSDLTLSFERSMDRKGTKTSSGRQWRLVKTAQRRRLT